MAIYQSKTIIIKTFFSALVFAVAVNTSYGQDWMRKIFLEDMIKEVVSEHGQYYTITIKSEAVRWDTTEIHFQYYLNELTPNESTESGRRDKDLIEKILVFEKEMSDSDLLKLESQIANQSKKNFDKERRIKGKNKNDFFQVSFSQPLILKSGNRILLKIKTDSKYCFETRISVYKRLGDLWTKDFDLYNKYICE